MKNRTHNSNLKPLLFLGMTTLMNCGGLLAQTAGLPPLPPGYIDIPVAGTNKPNAQTAGGAPIIKSLSQSSAIIATNIATVSTNRTFVGTELPKTNSADGGTPVKSEWQKSQKIDVAGGSVNFGDGVTGYKLKNYPINDLFQYLARLAGRQYFQSPGLVGLTISGQMMDGDPIKRMQEVAFQYGVSLYEKGDTIYAIPSSEVANMPLKQAEFKLRYLRSDKSKLKDLLTPYLTKGTGTIEFEDKTNTLIVQDNEPAIARIREFLSRVDVPQKQVTVQVRIFRITMGSDRNVGVSWEQTLGKNGLNITATAQAALTDTFGGTITKSILNSLANSVTNPGGASNAIVNNTSWGGNTTYTPFPTGNAGLTFSPVAITAVLHALYNNANAETESSPTIITEDNEVAVFSNLDKIPIVTTSATTSTGGTVNAPEVRYQPDPENPFDIGLKLTVKPTILPNNNVRLKITPSIGTVTGQVQAAGNSYPQCEVSSIDNIATIPNGYTVVFGGFSSYSSAKTADKVPVLGDIPGLGLLFSSKGNSKTRSNLVFFVTATGTNPDSAAAVKESDRIRKNLIADPKAQYADDDHLGDSATPNLARALKDELTPFTKKQKSRNPLSPENPDNANEDIVTGDNAGNDAVPANTPKKRFKPWEAIIPSKSANGGQ